MAKLKDINLSDLGIKNKKEILERIVANESEMEFFTDESSPPLFDKMGYV
jgi:hypothetical protein